MGKRSIIVAMVFATVASFASQISCRNSGDGDADVDADGDADVDADGDADGDGDGDDERPRPPVPCDNAACVSYCRDVGAETGSCISESCSCSGCDADACWLYCPLWERKMVDEDACADGGCTCVACEPEACSSDEFCIENDCIEYPLCAEYFRLSAQCSDDFHFSLYMSDCIYGMHGRVSECNVLLQNWIQCAQAYDNCEPQQGYVCDENNYDILDCID
jgi:hypothetical protein